MLISYFRDWLIALGNEEFEIPTTQVVCGKAGSFFTEPACLLQLLDNGWFDKLFEVSFDRAFFKETMSELGIEFDGFRLPKQYEISLDEFYAIFFWLW